MDVYDFLSLATDDSYRVEICDLSDDATIVWMGEARDALQGKYTDYEVLSFDLYLTGEHDNVPTICLNIETNDDNN